ncbi:MAG: hypothetical protein ACQKBT_01500, partial [Puniceicoccales bacterium]
MKIIVAVLCLVPMISISAHASDVPRTKSPSDVINNPNAETPTSNSPEIMVVPTLGDVTIDGKDDDWDLSAGIWSYTSPNLVDKYSVWSHLMYDEKGIYLLMRYRDDSPMKNTTRGEDFYKSWRADAYQGRIIFDDKTPEEHMLLINAYYSSSEDKPYQIIHHGGYRKEPPYDGTGPYRQDQFDKYGITMDEHGGEIAFREWDDKDGYNLEAFWPWSYLRTSGEPLHAGDSFVYGLEAMWGNIDGSELRHRLVDSIKNDDVNRTFFFRARSGWGKAVLTDENNLNNLQEQKSLQVERLNKFLNFETYGSVPIEYTLPSDRDVTIAIENSEGLRVRNLIGEFPRAAGHNVDYWDCLDDQGNPVLPGKYKAIILDHEEIDVEFVNSIYNAGTPPWRVEGMRTWGSNHGFPTSIATDGDSILLSFWGTEGTSGLMRVSDNARMIWTDMTEMTDVTIHGDLAYAIAPEGYNKRTILRRFNMETGAFVLFEDENRSTESILPVEIRAYSVPKTSTIAYAYDKLFVLIPGHNFWRAIPELGQIEIALDTPGVIALEDFDNKLYALLEGGKIVQLDADGHVIKTLFTDPTLT